MKRSISLILSIMILVLAGCGNNEPADIGLTAREFVGRYHVKAAERHSILKLPEGIEKTDKGERGIFFLLGDSVVLSLKLAGNTEFVSEVNVFCEPEGFYERDILEKATAAYLFSIQAAGVNLSEQDAFSIINELCINLRNSSKIKDKLKFTAYTYDGILTFGIKASE